MKGYVLLYARSLYPFFQRMGDSGYIRQTLEHQAFIIIRAFTTQLQRLCSNGLTIEFLCLLLYNHGLPRSFACLLNLFPLQRLYVTVA